MVALQTVSRASGCELSQMNRGWQNDHPALQADSTTRTGAQLYADSRVDTAVVDAFTCLRCDALPCMISSRLAQASVQPRRCPAAELCFSLHRDLRLRMPPTEALIAARCMELLNTFDTSLLADLRQLSNADPETFPDQPRCSQLLRMYSEVITMHSWLMLHPPALFDMDPCGHDNRRLRSCTALCAVRQAGRRLAGVQPAELKQGDRAAPHGTVTPELSGPALTAVAFRSSKKALLWDCLLAHEQASSM